MNQTSYPVAPSTGDQRIRPSGASWRCGIACHAVLNPKGAPQRDVWPFATTRTRAQSAYGLPVIQGTCSWMDATGAPKDLS